MKNRFSSSIKPLLLTLFTVIFISAVPEKKTLPSNTYNWDDLKVKAKRGTQVRNIMKGETRSLEMIEIKAVTLPEGFGSSEYRVKKGFDELLIIMEGMAIVSVNEKSERLNEGSVIVASQGDKVKIQNGAKNDMTFYSFQFKPKNAEGVRPTIVKTEPVLKEWREIEFKTTANGGRRDILRQPTSVLKELEMHTTQLKEGISSHSAHRHPDEEIVLMRFGVVEEVLNDKTFECGPGAVMFLTNDDAHGVRNIGTIPCEYYAFRWLTYQDTTDR